MQYNEDPIWRASALKKILMSGVGLCASIGFVVIMMAMLFDSPLWHLWVVAFFAVVLLVAQHFASRYLKSAITLLIIIIYAAAIFIKVLVEDPLLSDIGLIFLYTSPFLALVLLNQRVSSILVYVNVVPFLLVNLQFLGDVYVQTVTPDLSYVYLHLLLFVFFNFVLPFAMIQMIQEAKQTGVVRLEAQKSAVSRKKIYETLFKLSRQPSLIVRSVDGALLDVNESLTQLLTQADIIMLRYLIVSQKMAIDQANEASIGGREFLVWRRPIENNGNELYVLEEVSQIHDLRKVIDQLEMESTDLRLNDKMTKLPNRESLEQYLKAVGKSDKPAYLLCFRSELSEHYALSLSAEEFSIAQIRYAKAMQDELDGDFVAKLSRHVFASVIQSITYDQLLLKVNKVLKRNSSLTEEISAKKSKLTKFSCALIPKTKFDVGYLIDQTERLLFVSSLKHPVVQYQPTQTEKMFQEILLRSDMEQAIVAGEFSFVLQPKVKSDGSLLEFEALIRWKRLNEFIPPDIFIPIAESHGLVSQLTDWLLNEVCSYLASQSNLQKQYPISINISAMDLIRNDFVERILKTLTEHAVAPTMLGIELTETAFLANLDLAVSQLKKLQFWGVRISIDDFGTGYSSLSRLSDFPVDVLKLDRSFLIGLATNPRRLILIESMIELCRKLDIEVVVEGVETAAELSLLRSFSSLRYQGYFFSVPLNLHDVSILLSHVAIEKPIYFPLKAEPIPPSLSVNNLVV